MTDISSPGTASVFSGYKPFGSTPDASTGLSSGSRVNPSVPRSADVLGPALAKGGGISKAGTSAKPTDMSALTTGHPDDRKSLASSGSVLPLTEPKPGSPSAATDDAIPAAGAAPAAGSMANIGRPIVSATPVASAADSTSTDAKPGLSLSDLAAGDKRKAEAEHEQGKDGVFPLTASTEMDDDGESAVKRARTNADVASAPGPKAPTGEADLAGAANGKKGSRAKKEKKTLPPVGRTARKTRSQGPVDA